MKVYETGAKAVVGAPRVRTPEVMKGMFDTPQVCEVARERRRREQTRRATVFLINQILMHDD